MLEHRHLQTVECNQCDDDHDIPASEARWFRFGGAPAEGRIVGSWVETTSDDPMGMVYCPRAIARLEQADEESEND